MWSKRLSEEMTFENMLNEGREGEREVQPREEKPAGRGKSQCTGMCLAGLKNKEASVTGSE